MGRTTSPALLALDPSQRRKPVDAVHVVLTLVRAHAVVTFARGPFVQLRARPLVAIARHTVPAGVRDAIELHTNHGPDGTRGRKLLAQRRELRIAGLGHRTAPVEPHDLRRTVEGAQHDDDAPVLAQMGDGLRPAADEVEIGDRRGAEDSERVEPLRRQVHVPGRANRRGRDEEDVLRCDERAERIVDGRVALAHESLYSWPGGV